jgi:hypothetical protein
MKCRRQMVSRDELLRLAEQLEGKVGTECPWTQLRRYAADCAIAAQLLYVIDPERTKAYACAVARMLREIA